jgi:hypothetical protein
VTEPLPPGPYDLFYADPPLVFATWSDRGDGPSPQRNYRCMTVAARRLSLAIISGSNMSDDQIGRQENGDLEPSEYQSGDPRAPSSAGIDP